MADETKLSGKQVDMLREAILAGDAGTLVVHEQREITWWPDA